MYISITNCSKHQFYAMQIKLYLWIFNMTVTERMQAITIIKMYLHISVFCIKCNEQASSCQFVYIVKCACFLPSALHCFYPPMKCNFCYNTNLLILRYGCSLIWYIFVDGLHSCLFKTIAINK